MKRYYKVTLRTMMDEREEFVVEAEDIPTLAKKLTGVQITFVPSMQADSKSVSIFSHYIKTIRYEAVNRSPFDPPSTIFEVYSY